MASRRLLLPFFSWIIVISSSSSSGDSLNNALFGLVLRNSRFHDCRSPYHFHFHHQALSQRPLAWPVATFSTNSWLGISRTYLAYAPMPNGTTTNQRVSPRRVFWGIVTRHQNQILAHASLEFSKFTENHRERETNSREIK